MQLLMLLQYEAWGKEEAFGKDLIEAMRNGIVQCCVVVFFGVERTSPKSRKSWKQCDWLTTT